MIAAFQLVLRVTPKMTTDTDWCRGLPIVVTGGLGFIGSNLALRLESLGARVTLIDKMLTQYGANPHNIADPIPPHLMEKLKHAREWLGDAPAAEQTEAPGETVAQVVNPDS